MARPPEPVPIYSDDLDAGYDAQYAEEAAQAWDEYSTSPAWDDETPNRPRSRGSRLAGQLRSSRLRQTGSARPRTARQFRTPSPTVRIPNVFAQVELFRDQVSVALLVLATLSSLLMAGVLAGRLGNLPDVVTLRYDASGAATRWGTPESLWELPLLAGMVSLINGVLAWWLARMDRFASRFVLGTAVLVSVLAWISLIRFLW